MKNTIEKNSQKTSNECKDCTLDELISFHEEKIAEQKALRKLLEALTKNKEKYKN